MFDFIFTASDSVGITKLIFIYYNHASKHFVFVNFLNRYETTILGKLTFFFTLKSAPHPQFGNYCSNPDIPQQQP